LSTIFNRVDKNAPMVLQSSTNYDLSKFKPAAYITDHGNILYYYILYFSVSFYKATKFYKYVG